MKQTPLKSTHNQLKKTPLKSNSKGLKVSSSLRKVGNINIITLKNKKVHLKQTGQLKNNGSELNKNTELKKQNEKSKTKWEQVRNQILERDNFKCIVCGKPATQVHHIHLRSKRKDLIYEKNNLVSLCDKCHFHQSNDLYKEQTEVIAKAKHITVEELLKFAETRSEE
ncbi:MAG: HNH endonuclease [Bacilli bacterium]|nr:HNH endonuclease [Clostridia bacterium]MBR4618090.1 HNH endonuclease [Bacilli bacterium]